ncbi:hypothetical protein K6V25_16070 [Bacteroides salyersiae]|uniref:hypothetical protein n=1 Tax=Bacteroides salyersiae TaxID=291644 RepID=UPI001CCB1872|nr:hypothetical protein [Bacteroides salyersiae]UBD64419.1 hypothetical protein K6V25_16070 [Bacteroides salyersiae]
MYKTYDINGNIVSNHDLQDKGFWCQTGISKEKIFINMFGEKLGLIINPEKATNKYAPDLFNTSKQLLADLKTQNTPFFLANKLFNYPPQHTVVFNVKDYIRYKKSYPNIEIYFAVDWQVIKYESKDTCIEVRPMVGVWKVDFPTLEEKLKNAPIHCYSQRKNDIKGNATQSYVLNLLNDKSFIKVI